MGKTIQPFIHHSLPRSKWHSTSKSNQANLAHKPLKSKTATTNPTALQPTILKNRVPSNRKVHTITITTSSEETESIVLMIREPSQRQQTDLIELPSAEVHSSHNSMASNSLSNVSPTTNKNHLNLTQRQIPNLNLNTDQTQNRTTIVKIPKQTSRPRIFLLTRPAKPSLVRIAAPIAQPHHQKDLNSLPHHHTQTLKAVTIRSQDTPKIARIQVQQPFVPRSPVKILGSVNQTHLQKKDTIQVPQEPTHYESLNQKITALQRPQSELKSQDSLIIHQEIIQYPQQILSPPEVTTIKKASELGQSPTKGVKKPITIQENKQVLLAQYNLAKRIKMKGLSQAQLPLTLASMAGIELTGADMSHTAADMSGAMPPTATVEEINVPVFLDEYLQQAAAISTTASATSVTTTTTNNIIYNNDNNNNSSNTNNISNYQGSDEDETTVVEVKDNNNINNSNNNNHCLETFDNFEFDIDLLTENNSDDDQDKALELQLLQSQQHQSQQQELFVQQQQQQQQQQQENNFDNSEKQKQQLQLMLEEILFNSSNNNNKDDSCSNNNTNSNNNILNNNTNTNNNSNNNNTFKMANGLFDCEIDDLFNVAPNSQVLEEIRSPPLHDMDLSNFSPTMENAVDFNQSDNDCLSLMGLDMDNNTTTSYFINSQTNAVMFSTGITSAASSQNLSTYPSVAALSQEILGAEPHIPPDMIHYPHSLYAPEPTSSSSNFEIINGTSQYIDDDAMDYNDMKLETTTTNPLKRNGNHNTQPHHHHKHLQEKRMKLRLDIKRHKEIDTQSQDLDTPAIINSILQNDEFNTCVMSPAENSTDIYNQLINSPHESSVKSEIDTGDYTNDITPPYTPYSVNSTSQQTNFTGIINTAPSSPASSIATTNATSSATTRRGRGRPAKIHSDMPDLSRVQSETERKKALERYKNNEASRKSRLKNKERDQATEQEERELTVHKEELELELQRLKRIERKFRQALKRQHFRR